MMTRQAATLLLGAGLALGMGAGAAAPAAPVGPSPVSPREIVVIPLGGRPGGAELRVRGIPVMRWLGRRAMSRLQGVAARLEPLLPPPTAVTARATRRSAQLIVDGRVVITITRAELGRQGLPGPMVERWAQALHAALAVPPIVVSRADIVLSPGRTESVSITTAGAAPVVVGAHDERVVEVRLSGNEAHVTGKTIGRTVVPFRAGPYRAQVPVSVRPPAGRIPAETDVIVTGVPAPPDLVRQAVERRLQDVVDREPGAVLTLGPVVVDGPLAPGQSATFPVMVGVKSPYAGPVDATVQVRVTNLPVQLDDAGVLLVSNRPEKITDNGLLFRDTLAPGKAARLLYHHLNGTPGQERILKITLHNPGATRARVHYLSGHGGPSGDPIYIGFAATQRFLDALVGGRGYVVEVPAGRSATFTAYGLPPLALVSGLMQFQVIEGGPVDLVVHVRVPYLLDNTVTADLGPRAFPHPRGTFPGSVVEVAREHAVDRPGLVAELGVMSNLQDVRTGEPLVGDYGVLYRLRLRLVNSTDREVTTALVANAAGGLARGLFYIDGTPVDIGLARPYEDREVAVFAVAPRASRDVLVLTMPVAGSFYPVRLGLRPR